MATRARPGAFRVGHRLVDRAGGGACKGDACVPLGRSADFDLSATAERLGMALVQDAGAAGGFAQGPLEGGEDAWSVDSDFRSEVDALGEGEYYPRTL